MSVNFHVKRFLGLALLISTINDAMPEIVSVTITSELFAWLV